MPTPKSQQLKGATNPLPDGRNLGSALRIMLGANLLVLAAAVVRAPRWSYLWDTYSAMSAWAVPLIFLYLSLYILGQGLLHRLPPRRAQITILVIALVSGALIHRLAIYLFAEPEDWWETIRFSLLLTGVVAAVLFYFTHRTHKLIPAISEARLLALNARIRPHFLFNSINTVLALVRREPKRAETSLQSLAELYRCLLQDPLDQVELHQEIEICRQYIDLEKLRLGDQLKMNWRVDDVPDNLLIPTLILQPLLENAVYHGIETIPEGGVITLRLYRSSNELNIEVENPLPKVKKVPTHNYSGSGFREAHSNIRERLALYYDLEASFHCGEVAREDQTCFQVKICLPWRESNQ